MASSVTIDLRHVARGLDFSLRQVQAVVELLDDGNTVPFITRYRKDQTGGLDEEQIREIQARLTKLRLLADRKSTILRSIEAQGKLTDILAKQILAATTTKRLEDLYLPFKPKKQTLATLARVRGLEELAAEILAAAPACADLDARAAQFVSVDRQVASAADALLGAGHILAEQFSERADLRQRLREILHRTGRIVTTQIGGEPAVAGPPGSPPAPTPPGAASHPEAAPALQSPPADPEPPPADPEPSSADPEPSSADQPPAAAEPLPTAPQSPPADSDPPPADLPAPTPPLAASPTEPSSADQPPAAAESAPAEPTAETPPAPDAPSSLIPHPSSLTPPPSALKGTVPFSSDENRDSPPPAKPQAAKARARTEKLNKKELKKKKDDERRIKAFRDYFNYGEEIKRIPPHRILAINRGERARVLRVKIESDLAAMHADLEELLIPPGHPHAEYLRGCARDALARLILPALEREARRELTDRAELHAVGVFARNLRNLLLQPPVHQRRVLAVDPGFRSGCKLAALDQFGNVLGHDVIYLVGKPAQKQEARQKSLDLLRKFELTVVAIGNGTACRQTEDFFAELLTGELQGQGVAYVIVNEAGASVYSTSQLGREEFPQYDATLRGAISIGRRLLDPLSELVKIEPANIGVGLYQHDVKAKHLQASLDEVVESCVNYVGVDVNTASPALLRYVSGLNQLTARRVYEHRRQHGPLRNRQQLRDVPGFGEATFVQAAGFLKIAGGDNPLDATWIHPESYPVAGQILQRLSAQPGDLTEKESLTALAERVAGVDLGGLAKELGSGELTLRDILAQLARPGRDPREDLPPPMFKQGILKIEDLTVGMELTGTVLNVVDFGCFVDIGMHDSGLVHVSRMADRFIRDPHEVAAVGDIVKVWVVEVDRERRRVSLTMVRPGSERPRRPAGSGPAAAAGQAGQAGTQDRPPAASGPPAGRGPRRGGRGYQQGRPAHDGQPAQEGRPAQGDRPPQGGRPAQGDRPPQGGRPAQGDRGRRGPPAGRPKPYGPPRDRPPPPKPRPKPIIPITEEMKAGKEPLRTFGDLMQFFEAKQVVPEPAPGPPPPEAAAAAPAPESPAETSGATGVSPVPVPSTGETPEPPEPAAAPSAPRAPSAEPAAGQSPPADSSP